MSKRTKKVKNSKVKVVLLLTLIASINLTAVSGIYLAMMNSAYSDIQKMEFYNALILTTATWTNDNVGVRVNAHTQDNLEEINLPVLKMNVAEAATKSRYAEVVFDDSEKQIVQRFYTDLNYFGEMLKKDSIFPFQGESAYTPIPGKGFLFYEKRSQQTSESIQKFFANDDTWEVAPSIIIGRRSIKPQAEAINSEFRRGVRKEYSLRMDEINAGIEFAKTHALIGAGLMILFSFIILFSLRSSSPKQKIHKEPVFVSSSPEPTISRRAVKSQPPVRQTVAFQTFSSHVNYPKEYYKISKVKTRLENLFERYKTTQDNEKNRARMKALDYVAIADMHFGNKDYAEALDYYQKAVNCFE